MITQATISHYKSIAEAKLSFSPMNVIVGSNGVGKSNIVDALYFLRDCVEEDIDTAVLKRHGIESIRQWSKTRPYHISIEVDIARSDGFGRYKLVLSSARGAYRVIEELGEWTGDDPFSDPDPDENNNETGSTLITASFRRGEDNIVHLQVPRNEELLRGKNTVQMPPTELFLTTIGGPVFSLFNMVIRPIAEELRSFVAYSIYPNTLREPRAVSRQERLLADGSNLASILKNINSHHKKNKELLINAMKVVMPTITDIAIKSAGGYYVPVIMVKEPSGEIHQFNMSQISDGTLRALGILTAFYQPNTPTIIAIEEPEQMIHPGILPIITEAAEEFCRPIEGRSSLRQAFITTHSPPLLDLVDPESIIWTTFQNGITTSGRISERQLDLVKRQLFSPGEIMLSEGFFE
jgi:predicted ATPase